MKVQDVMSRNVFTIRRDATIQEAARAMLEHRVSGLPVVENGGTVIGMLTEGDLLRRREPGTERHASRLTLFLNPGRAAEDYARAYGRFVSEVMTPEVISVGPEMSLEDAIDCMERERIKRLPVMDGTRLVGIFSRSDLLPIIANFARDAAADASSDSATRERVLAAIARERWAPAAQVDVTVSNGMVDLRGVILDMRDRTALRVIVENVPGVKGVRDHLVWIEPMSGSFIESEETATATQAAEAHGRQGRC